MDVLGEGLTGRFSALMLLSGVLWCGTLTGNTVPLILGGAVGVVEGPFSVGTPGRSLPLFPRSITFVLGDFLSSSCDANMRSLLSSAAASGFPINLFCCTNLDIIWSMRVPNEEVISLFRTSAKPSRSGVGPGGRNSRSL